MALPSSRRALRHVLQHARGLVRAEAAASTSQQTASLFCQPVKAGGAPALLQQLAARLYGAPAAASVLAAHDASFGVFGAGGLTFARRASSSSGPAAASPQQQQAAGVHVDVQQELDDLPVQDERVAQAQRVLQALSACEFKQIVERAAEKRPDVSFAEWEELCSKSNVAFDRSGAAEVLESMQQSGVVLHFQERVYLKPQEIAESIIKALARDFPTNDESVSRLAEQLRELEEKKEEVEQVAHQRTSRFLWVSAAAMFTQFSAFAYMTFGDNQPGWDVMEPVTFFYFYFLGFACYIYFLVTRQEFSWPGFRDKMLAKEVEKYASKHNLDLREYERLLKRTYRFRHMMPRVR